MQSTQTQLINLTYEPILVSLNSNYSKGIWQLRLVTRNDCEQATSFLNGNKKFQFHATQLKTLLASRSLDEPFHKIPKFAINLKDACIHLNVRSARDLVTGSFRSNDVLKRIKILDLSTAVLFSLEMYFIDKYFPHVECVKLGFINSYNLKDAADENNTRIELSNFKNMRTLEIAHLKYSLTLKNCPSLKKFVCKKIENSDSIITSLILQNLHELEVVELPNFENIEIQNCPKLIKDYGSLNIPNSKMDQANKILYFDMRDDLKLTKALRSQASVDSFNKLAFFNIPSQSYTWLAVYLLDAYCPNITKLKSDLINTYCSLSKFQNLKELEIENVKYPVQSKCLTLEGHPNLKKIVCKEISLDDHTLVVKNFANLECLEFINVKLKSLVLENLPKLNDFSLENATVDEISKEFA